MRLVERFAWPEGDFVRNTCSNQRVKLASFNLRLTVFENLIVMIFSLDYIEIFL